MSLPYLFVFELGSVRERLVCTLPAGFSATDAAASQRAVDFGFVEAEHFLLLPHSGRTLWLLAMMVIF